jgi:hypothetical protein
MCSVACHAIALLSTRTVGTTFAVNPRKRTCVVLPIALVRSTGGKDAKENLNFCPHENIMIFYSATS